MDISPYAGKLAIRTENIYKIYAESFKDQTHLDTIVNEAEQIVTKALAGS